MNSDTNQILRDGLPVHNRIAFDPNRSYDDLIRSLRAYKGRAIFVLGHVEEGAFLARDAAGKEILRMPIERAQQILADCCDVQVIAIGCDAASVAGSTGTIGLLNSVQAARKLVGLKNARNMQEVYATLSSGPDGLKIVVGEMHISRTDSTTALIRLSGDVMIERPRKTRRSRLCLALPGISPMPLT
jgi:hypothetical protein